MPKACSSDKILNPATGRCVSKTGKIGRALLAQYGGDVSPPAAIIEYLKCFPLANEEDVKNFYEKVNSEWRDDANVVNIFSKSKKRVNSINDVLIAVSQAKKTTFCNRKTGDGDCEETADEVISIIEDNPRGNYIVDSLRLEYYEYEEDSESDPVFVQNHGFLAFYNEKTKKIWYWH